MIKVRFDPNCVHFMRDIGMPPDRPGITINDRHVGLITDGLNRIIAAHWFGDDELVLVESIVKDKQVEGDEVCIKEVEVHFALHLRSNLPAGVLTRQTDMESMLSIVAASFGCPIVGYPGAESTYLYSGPWDKKLVEVQGSGQVTWMAGTFYPEQERCELVWALNVDQYREWLAQNVGPSNTAVIPSRTALQPLIGNVERYIREFPANFPTVLPTPEAIQFGLAQVVIRATLGTEWVERNIGSATMQAQMQIAELGETIFNLQAVPGFQGRLEALRTSDFDSTMAELHAARLLANSNLPFAFVDPSGTKGSDYEAQLVLPSGHIASCEVKTKREDTSLTSNTILNSLKQAGSQSPPDMPLIVFMKIPEQWTKQRELAEAIEKATSTFFRHYARSIAVVFFWEEWSELPNASLMHSWRYREFINERSRHYDEKNAFLIRSFINPPKAKSWVRFAEMIEEYNPGLGH